MAATSRIPVEFGAVFPQGVLVLSVDPVNDFEKERSGTQDPQERDKDTGQRLWAVSVMDPTAPPKQREITIKVPAEQQPVPPNGIMHPAEFEGLVVIPWVEDGRRRPDGSTGRSRIKFAYRAAGFRAAKRAAA